LIDHQYHFSVYFASARFWIYTCNDLSVEPWMDETKCMIRIIILHICASIKWVIPIPCSSGRWLFGFVVMPWYEMNEFVMHDTMSCQLWHLLFPRFSISIDLLLFFFFFFFFSSIPFFQLSIFFNCPLPKFLNLSNILIIIFSIFFLIEHFFVDSDRDSYGQRISRYYYY